jgi:hypothetical protein
VSMAGNEQKLGSCEGLVRFQTPALVSAGSVLGVIWRLKIDVDPLEPPRVHLSLLQTLWSAVSP